MSTPTTAVATLPRSHYHHYHHHPPYSHHQHQQPQHQGPHGSTAASAGSSTNAGNTTTNYRSAAANSLLPPTTASSASASTSAAASTPASSSTSRLLPFYQQQNQQHTQPPATAGYTSSDGVVPSAAPRPPPHKHHDHHHDSRHHHDSAASASTAAASTAAPAASLLDPSSSASSSTAAHPGDSFTSAMTSHTMQGDDLLSRKRRRSREPDWNNFYRNGLPKEIIVIDDSPEPEANTGRKITNGNSVVANGTSAAIPSFAHTTAPARDSPARQPAKKRRREDNADPTRPAGYHVQYVASHTGTPLQNSTSSDRTNSAINTTAPTSLSSNGQYEDVQPLKRKRTRQQVANEAKRRDVDGFGDSLFTYKPPPYPPKKASEVHVRVVHDHYPKNVTVDDDDGHYIVVPDAELTEKYTISKLLGQGTFGKVVEARDRRRNKPVAVKIIRSVQKYRDASRIELRVLATLKANDEENRNRCIHLRDCFDYRGHICIVMDLLGQSVFDFLKGNGFVPFPNSQIQNFARQLFTSVAFLHDLNLIHTDLKPENILLCSNHYQTFTYNRKIPSSSTTINRQATQRRVLLDTEIRLIDFGSATFQDEYHSSVVSTRHYRAPEIILGLGWSYPCDIWSIGCILVEFFTGDALFQTHDNLEHLAMMEAVVGTRIDPYLVQSVNKMSTRGGGNAASKYFKRLKLDYPTPDTTRGSRRFVKAMKNLHDIIPSNNTFFKNFLDLLRRIFVYDPARRITAKQALNHPWFKEMAMPDDGTEAAKIRLERQRMAQESARNAQFVG